ncbi:uncharacterized protein LOC143593905 [Bidens hawaiensis]|uniref:uncharacterized protein LOC143593905 n=1 Tax=Bidens hawaiensis TaxID=980011 RepID=UPI00404B3FE4
MDFKSLNRRELQSLCKINKIPANITNVAMVDALKSLHIVVGIEEILNASHSEAAGSSIKSPENNEITSPRVPQTSIRTSNWKKVKNLETESVLATASRASHGVRKKLTGEGKAFMKTPLVSNARPKRPTTSIVKRESSVQKVYNTRRSSRLTEKKCAEACVTERDISRPVKIASFLEEVSVTSKISVESDSSSLEASNESNTLFGVTEYNVEEGSVENYDEGTSKAKVEDIRIEFEKLDVVIKDGSDHNSVIEEGDCCGENVDLEYKHKVEKRFILNELRHLSKKGNKYTI